MRVVRYVFILFLGERVGREGEGGGERGLEMRDEEWCGWDFELYGCGFGLIVCL